MGGATIATCGFPSDAQISAGAAFVSHLKSFWRDVIILTSATVVAFGRYPLRQASFTRLTFQPEGTRLLFFEFRLNQTPEN
jgi:hypothetical protein